MFCVQRLGCYRRPESKTVMTGNRRVRILYMIHTAHTANSLYNTCPSIHTTYIGTHTYTLTISIVYVCAHPNTWTHTRMHTRTHARTHTHNHSTYIHSTSICTYTCYRAVTPHKHTTCRFIACTLCIVSILISILILQLQLHLIRCGWVR